MYLLCLRTSPRPFILYFVKARPLLASSNLVAWDRWVLIRVDRCNFSVWRLFHMPLIDKDAGITTTLPWLCVPTMWTCLHGKSFWIKNYIVLSYVCWIRPSRNHYLFYVYAECLVALDVWKRQDRAKPQQLTVNSSLLCISCVEAQWLLRGCVTSVTKGIGGVHDNPNVVLLVLWAVNSCNQVAKTNCRKKHPQFGQGKHSSSYKEDQILKYMTVPNVIDICYVT